MELDLRGLICPLPLIRLTETLQQLPTGTRCRLVADDPGFADDLADWCAVTGHRLLRLERDSDGGCRAELSVSDGGDGRLPATVQESPCAPG